MGKRSKTSGAESKRGRSSPGRPTTRRRARGLNPGSLIVAAGFLAFAALGYAVIRDIVGSKRASRPIEGVQSYPNLPRGHQDGLLTYDQSPPAGGVHNPVWQNCGVYTTPIADENAVHSLEHGTVWITYTPDLSPEELGPLQSLTSQSSYRLLSPYAGLPTPIVASAWGYQLRLDSADDPRLTRFIQTYESSPLGPEQGAPCTGGVGQPG